MIIVHVDDMLLATNNSHHAESHISRLLGKFDIKDVKRTDDDGGVLYCRQDQLECVKARCEPASLSRVRARQKREFSTTGEIREMRSMTGSLHLVTRGTRPDESSRVAEETISAPGVRRQPEIGLRVRPLPTKICVLVNADSALHNAECPFSAWCVGLCGGPGRSGED